MSEGELIKKIRDFAKYADEVRFSSAQIIGNSMEVLDEIKNDFPYRSNYYPSGYTKALKHWFTKWFGDKP
jgi:hypothetical protein